jgi:hypothetical protein
MTTYVLQGGFYVFKVCLYQLIDVTRQDDHEVSSVGRKSTMTAELCFRSPITRGKQEQQTQTTLPQGAPSLRLVPVSQTESWLLSERTTSGCQSGKSMLTTNFVSGETSKLESSWCVNLRQLELGLTFEHRI